MGKLKSYQEQVQEAIEKGINNVEEQYKTLSAKPFELAEKVEAEAKSYSVKTVRERHNEYVASLYDSLRTLNKRLGGYAGDLIGRFEKEVAEEAKAVEEATKPAPRKPAARKTSSAKKAEAATA
ncbi:hypothetical protein [Mangrovitalea sediminis]|uniref:hypothetical protein n=1 Tax=Mangrovitalea sediminis TaxID=1982043 RepID=UPI000BE56ED1|nr:hypothetical protein [Mangrovitalea sediminis]